MYIQVDEVISRTKQGATEPYICICEEKKLYYVKGKGAGYGSLIKEWVAGKLAQHLNLPIPAFAIVEVPKALYQAGASGLLSSLGFGPLFGSQEVPNCNEISFYNASTLHVDLKRDIAAFDWWIKNGDRTLKEPAGNPNILWSETTEEPFIIDHNLAFDETVTLSSLIESHMFSASLLEIANDSTLQNIYNQKFQSVLPHVHDICDDIPDRWHYEDDMQSVEVNISVDTIKTTLERFSEQGFWKQP